MYRIIPCTNALNNIKKNRNELINAEYSDSYLGLKSYKAVRNDTTINCPLNEKELEN